MKVVVALGNPGKEYEFTRHNAGWLALDSIIKEDQLNGKKSPKLHSEIFDWKLDREKIILAKPDTFMNNSGLAVVAILNFYNISLKDLVVIHDDKDIPVGEIRVQTDRGAAGHNGIKSIIEKTGSKNFTRIRVGVGPNDKEKIKIISDYVLNKFTKEEFKVLQSVFDNIKSEIRRLALVE
jgi:PTH1 family peptidyl-tRNA hydrolase